MAATTLTIHVKPNAKHTSLVSHEGNILTLRLHAKPIDGEANAELLRFLSEYLNIPKSKLQITSGQTSRIKRIKILT